MIAPHLSWALILTIPLPHILTAAVSRPMPRLRTPLIVLTYLACLLLPLRIESYPGLVLLLSVSIPVFNLLLLRRMRNNYLAGTLLLIVNVSISITVFGTPVFVTGFTGWLENGFMRLASGNVLAAAVSRGELETFLFYAVGILLVSLGLNDPIALYLKRSHLMPGAAGDESPAESFPVNPEPARGRIIGYLERAIILVLMLTDNIGAIGFVLAAKGFTRFKQLDDRDFAEYVLIGTLLSVSATMLAGSIMMALI
ncbi:hypothetical protein [Marispirochaeta sp.]|jgi:hypothetical protein|uniref:hypothetical protein n=1 Tax=Marispirochaeta sp. TaxID=2038653 RepID=UPI0029C60913|nr:hypothetical protein [Marispirochaeta sp.]